MVFQILCQLHMCENSRFRFITQLRLWQSMAFCCDERLAHPLMEDSAGNFTWPRSSFSIKDGSVWLLAGRWYKLIRVSDPFHPVHDKSCWELCGCCRRPWYYMGYHFRSVGSFIFQYWLVPCWDCALVERPLSCLKHVCGKRVIPQTLPRLLFLLPCPGVTCLLPFRVNVECVASERKWHERRVPVLHVSPASFRVLCALLLHHSLRKWSCTSTIPTETCPLTPRVFI